MTGVCPECQQGKHQNCDGAAWDDATDAPGTCACPDSNHIRLDQLTLDLLGDPADDVLKTADISPDGIYRYALNRVWGRGHGILPWIMLNPSTADHSIDDPTIRRCMTFARDWGYTGITVANLYAFRATNPAELLTAADPVGPRNDTRLRDVLERAATDGLPVVAAWGVNAKPDRVARLRAMPHADRLVALAVSKDGHPRHPLYMPKTATLSTWPGSTR